ncbi:ribosomal protein RPL18 [Cardiosporidium cionae]|uniref:Ribosomal protein RPL18 n=1 Tax=Cardiosporidium cionae TaxID=476202 RepID=A0ABQ7JDV5_9APIC|nr:ribosomal protein RPL18 [Cardiosporidium cionae]|eukprot:KAF8822207.1 ribosomal protein RPL18 [Cardiosporidium cionae]
MGIDLKNKGHIKKPGRKEVKSPNPYLRLLVKLYQFLARRTSSPFNKVVLKRLIMAKRFKAPLSLSKLSLFMRKKEKNIAVVIGSVTDDIRLLKVPKIRVCALRFSENARNRIVNAGGECLTFDQLAIRYPKGSGCVLLRGPTKSREAEKHFGPAVGASGSHTKPYTRSKRKKFEPIARY